MTVTRGRLVKDAKNATPLSVSTHDTARARYVPREMLDARARADALVEEARAQARQLLDAAKEDIAREKQRVRAEVEQVEAEKVVDLLVALRKRAAEIDASQVDRAIVLAALLAERIVGRAIAEEPSTVGRIAREILREVNDERRIVIEVGSRDEAALRDALRGAQNAPAFDIRVNDSLASGDLILHTDAGTLDGRLSIRLQTLSKVLMDALR